MSDMKRQSNVTSHEVAALAGVSRSSVSRAFTAGASVSDKTRKKVLTAAAELGYQPNALARSLTGRSSKAVAGARASNGSGQPFAAVTRLT
jgi:DNA-binding LacI/PurR family transcriptional regulator